MEATGSDADLPSGVDAPSLTRLKRSVMRDDPDGITFGTQAKPLAFCAAVVLPGVKIGRRRRRRRGIVTRREIRSVRKNPPRPWSGTIVVKIGQASVRDCSPW